MIQGRLKSGRTLKLMGCFVEIAPTRLELAIASRNLNFVAAPFCEAFLHSMWFRSTVNEEWLSDALRCTPNTKW